MSANEITLTTIYEMLQDHTARTMDQFGWTGHGIRPKLNALRLFPSRPQLMNTARCSERCK